MHINTIHAETRARALRKLIRDYPLGVLTTAIPSATHPLILSSHIPWVLDVENEGSETELGRLRGHLARANPQSKVMMASLTCPDGKSNGTNVLEQEVSILFTHPMNGYITPKFYTETMATTKKVVPTWDYSAVQAYGKATVYYDLKAEETGPFLTKALADLGRHSEEHLMGHTGAGGKPEPWTVAEAPQSYVELLTKAIIGVEVEITRMEGIAKMSQEKGEPDRLGVMQGLENLPSPVGRGMVELVKEQHELRKARELEKADR